MLFCEMCISGKINLLNNSKAVFQLVSNLIVVFECAVHKGRPHKIAKKLSPLVCKIPYWLNPPCPCRHTKNFERSEVFCIKKCGRPHLKNSRTLVCKISALDNPFPLTADCGWTTS